MEDKMSYPEVGEKGPIVLGRNVNDVPCELSSQVYLAVKRVC